MWIKWIHDGYRLICHIYCVWDNNWHVLVFPNPCVVSRSRSVWRPCITVWLIIQMSWRSLRERSSWWMVRRTRSGGWVSWLLHTRLQLFRWHTLYSNSGMRERTREEKWVYHISLPITGWLLISKLHWGPRSGSVSLAGKQAAGLYSVSRLRSHWLCLVNHSPWRLINGKAKSPNLCVPVWFQGYLHKNLL